MLNENEESGEVLTDKKNEQLQKITKIGKYFTLAAFIAIWVVTVGFGFRDLWNDVNIGESPWIITSLILSGILIIVVIIPLYLNLKSDVKAKIKEKEKKKGEISP